MPRFNPLPPEATGSVGATITVKDEGVTQSTTVDTLNFVGAGVDASGALTVATITVSGFLADVLANRPTASDPETTNMLFYATDTQTLYYSDGITWSTITLSASSGVDFGSELLLMGG